MAIPGNAGGSEDRVGSRSAALYPEDIVLRSYGEFEPCDEFLDPTERASTPARLRIPNEQLDRLRRTLLGAGRAEQTPVRWIRADDMRNTVRGAIFVGNRVQAEIVVPSRYFFGCQTSVPTRDGNRITFVYTISLPRQQGMRAFAIHLYVVGAETWRIVVVFDARMPRLIGPWRARLQFVEIHGGGSRIVERQHSAEDAAVFLDVAVNAMNALSSVLDATVDLTRQGRRQRRTFIDTTALDRASEDKLAGTCRNAMAKLRGVSGGVYGHEDSGGHV